MALTWSVAACADHEQLTKGEEWPVTQAVIFSTMSVGLGRITVHNAPEFYARATMLTRFDQGITAVPFTPHEIRARIGLHTNVRDEGRGEWIRRVFAVALDRHAHEYRLTEGAPAPSTDGG